jgi:hypothetical protein
MCRRVQDFLIQGVPATLELRSGRWGVRRERLRNGHNVRLEVVAEWLDDDNAEVAKWRQQRLEQWANEAPPTGATFRKFSESWGLARLSDRLRNFAAKHAKVSHRMTLVSNVYGSGSGMADAKTPSGSKRRLMDRSRAALPP